MERGEIQDSDPQSQSILRAASHHDADSLRILLRTGSANVRDSNTKRTPLHAAIAACGSASSTASCVDHTLSDDREGDHGVSGGQTGEGVVGNGDGEIGGGDRRNRSSENMNGGDGGEEEATVNATKIVRLLLQNGAIWNDIDINDETPGCLARRLGLKDLYEIMVDAGVRAEMLLNRLDEYEQLKDDEDEEEDEEKDGSDLNNGDPEAVNRAIEVPKAGEESLEPTLSSAITNLDNSTYLQSPLTIEQNRILDSSKNGVMMAWETKIMRRTATLLAPTKSLRILNIGHGMGIIDNFFQEATPSIHHIIEAHPSILAQMQRDGWATKPNITIHAGKWQDIVPTLINQEILFDAIYFDTYAEDYKALRDFFSDFVIGLLDERGRWGFFNGLGADREVCYDVYDKVVEMDLFEAGFDTEWETLELEERDKEEWEGVRRRYWTLDKYRLPVCRFVG